MSFTSKLLASEILELDEEFITLVAKKVKEIKFEEKHRTYTVDEVAEIKGVGPETIRRHIKNYFIDANVSKKYKLKATKTKKSYLINHSDLEEYLGKKIKS